MLFMFDDSLNIKRFFDFLVSFSGIIFLFPIFILISVFIFFVDGPPVFFCQERIGLNSRSFTLYKFRTMNSFASDKKTEFDMGNQRRVTSIGRLLRKSKLDELPQLFNVLKGDMSMVGPRPEVASWCEIYPERWRFVHSIRPGITDPASLMFKDEEFLLASSQYPEVLYRYEILPKKLTLYEEYILNRSFFADLVVIFKTIIALF